MAKSTSKKVKKIHIDAVGERKKTGKTQCDFWPKFGITQSGGSRYESGREMPKPVRMLMALASGKATC